MTDESPAQDQLVKAPKATWRDREFELKIPSGAQLMMWNRVAQQFGELAQADEVSNDRFRKMLNRLGDVVFGVFANQEDVDWLEDEIMAERVDDAGLLELFTTLRDGIIASQDDEGGAKPNRAQRRTAQRVK